MVRVTSRWTTLLGIERRAETVCCVVVPSSWVTVSLTVLLIPGRSRLTVWVRSSVRSGWWVSLTSGDMGILSAAPMSALIATPWTAWPTATGTEKRVSPLGTKNTPVSEPPAVTLTVPVMAVTSASINAVSVTSACPATVRRLTVSSIRVTQSAAMTSLTVPGVQPKEATLRSHSSPSADGRGWGICPSLRVKAPACPRPSSQEKVRDEVSPWRGRS